MSIVKSSAESLTLNADGSGNDVIIQSNGSTKVTVDGQNSRVGIGTTSPVRDVHIKNASFASLAIDGNASANSAGLLLYQNGTEKANVLWDNAATCLEISAQTSNDVDMMRIDASGNVGIGVVPDSELTTSYTNLQFGTGLLNQHDSYPHSVNLLANAIVKNSGTKQINTSYPSSYFQQWNGTFMFKAEAAGNAAITWSECLKVWNNTSSGPGFTVGGAWNTNGSDKLYSCHVENNVIGHRNVAKLTDTQTHWRFYNPNGSVGTITTYGSATSFNTSSDYRLKENVNYTWDATTRLKQLKPARFNFIADDTNTLVDGFIAHEAATVVPESVTGTKDAMMDEKYEVTPAVMDGETVVTEAVMGTRSVPEMQAIDQSKLVPLLVKTIQELEARLTAGGL